MRMTALPRACAAAALLCCVVLTAAADVAVPPLRARVTDLTGTLAQPAVAQLEQRLTAFEAQKGAQIAVLLVPTTQPETMEQYAVRVFEQWKLGRKGIDDGVLLVIARNDRTLRIEVGYGLEGVLTDAAARRIISDGIVPHLKRGDFAAGVEAGVTGIMSVINGEALPPPVAARRGQPANPWFDPAWLITAAVLVHVLGRLLRAVFGRLPAAGLMSMVFGAGVWWVFGSLLAALAVGVAAFFVALAEGLPARFGGRSGGWHSGSGSWSSGGSPGGGFGGGGGGSGGGGASGRW